MSVPTETIIDDDAIAARAGFYWREADGVRVLVCQALEDNGFVNGFSTRMGGVSPFPSADLNLAGFNEDSAENIFENRRRFLKAFPPGMKLAAVWQVHGDQIKIVSTAEEIGDSEDKADGVICGLPGILAAVKTADCVPVLIADPDSGAFAAIHAGWRGTVRSIAAKAISLMQELYGSDPSNLLAAIGPAALCGNYEVGSEVIEEFGKNFANSSAYFKETRPGHALVDLHAANRDQLIGAGIAPGSIAVAPYCTMERVDLFFSYRREKAVHGKTGRLLSVIGRA